MAIEFKTQQFPGRFPEIWRGECKMLPGGFKPTQEFPVGTVVRRATPLYVDFDTMTAAVCKTATVLNGGTTKEVRVPKGHYFVAGDKIIKLGATELGEIDSIDRTNDAYDILKLKAAYTGIQADDVIAEGVAVTEGQGDSATTTNSVRYSPNNIVGEDKEFTGRGLPTLDAAYEAVVLMPSLLFPMLPEWLTGIALKNNPNIIYIKQ
ncbi:MULTISPECIES: hypothetical protein [Muribaculaceae]|uniref:Uncharacterized protein n=2 Tax=Muribaculaceae TaxID=2005473 RepID=A0A4Z0V3J9_9BACT|nr:MULTISPECIES: hypothetical protein [Muribaculaceae]QCD37163.1 hypothetical protein E7746_14580 [Muribaculum gordoncarteri]TGG35087.1 hypothetical protein EZ315_15490 [Duncaniella freteri]